MKNPMNLNVRIESPLSDFVRHNISREGNYDSVSDYIIDLISKDKGKHAEQIFLRLKADLRLAFSASEIESIRAGTKDPLVKKWFS